MKKIQFILLVFFLFIVSNMTFGQDSMIIKETKGTTTEIFNKVNKQLFLAGYGIHSFYKDSQGQFAFVTTTERPIRGGVIVRLTVFVESNVIYVRGVYWNNSDPDFIVEVTRKGMNNSSSLNAWEEMEQFTSRF